ncbi:hypothetical protein GCM10027589_53190 [Actinocorallia lasiicapitis]
MSLLVEPAPVREAVSPRRARPARREGRAALVVGLAITGLLLGRLLLGGTVGFGDQGDAHRLMCSVGVADATPYNELGPRYLHLKWNDHRWYGETCGSDGSGEPYESTQLWLLWGAKYLSGWMFGGGGLDLRALGVLCSGLAGLVCAGLFLVLPGSRRMRLCIVAGLALIFADSAFAGYFISPYSEPAALLGSVTMLIALIAIWKRGHSTVPLLAAVCGAAAFTIAAKTQTVAYMPAVALGLLAVPFRGPWVDARWTGGNLKMEWLRRRLPALVALSVLAVFCVGYLQAQPERFRYQNTYNAIFGELLPNSPDPAGDLVAMGLDPAWASASGSNLYSANALAGTPVYEEFKREASLGDVGLFYLTHPDRLPALFERGIATAVQLRPAYLGSFEKSEGHGPYAQEHRVMVVSWLFAVFQWAHWLMIAQWVLLVIGGLLVVNHQTMSRRRKAYGWLALFIAVSTVCQFWAVMFSDGTADGIKHMVFVDFLTALGLPVLGACAVLLVNAVRSALPLPAPRTR